MATLISHNPDETEALGEAWGREVQAGWVIGLSGDLGAGKTRLVKGLARGLGITARVQSPTFALVNIYPGGRLPLFHLDLYRLDTPEQILAAGLEEYLHPAGVTVIEWAERWFAQNQSPGAPLRLAQSSGVRFPQPFRWVQIEAVNETERRITYEDIGS
ncbi:MAG TPA: tRNA (adenosine(37)-N6)-threonylcarbamoyltransferase complex ATPase subunit type 1 TsaE [Bacillota bacterium]|nr:tRNA (adenosine(37)-N6)-threonylcarbamoyltransferase complex ATPase subunit type 1 TsaE [Bacillota bacterium]